jgi:hypothetical protein
MKSVIYTNLEKLHLSANESGHKDIFIAPFSLSMDDHAIPFHILANRMSVALRKYNRFLRHQDWDKMTVRYTKIT